MALGLILLATATTAGVGLSYKANQENKQANAYQQQLADNKAGNERRRMIKQARIRRGQLQNAASATGTNQSSSFNSAASGINNELGFNLSESFATQATSGKITKTLGRASNYQFLSQASNALGTVAMGSINRGE